MAIGANDIASRAYTWTKVAGAAMSTTPVRVFGVLVQGGSVASACSIYNAATASGDPIVVNALTNDVGYVSFGPNGIRFGTALYAAIAGTGAAAWVWYMVE